MKKTFEQDWMIRQASVEKDATLPEGFGFKDRDITGLQEVLRGTKIQYAA